MRPEACSDFETLTAISCPAGVSFTQRQPLSLQAHPTLAVDAFGSTDLMLTPCGSCPN